LYEPRLLVKLYSFGLHLGKIVEVVQELLT